MYSILHTSPVPVNHISVIDSEKKLEKTFPIGHFLFS